MKTYKFTREELLEWFDEGQLTTLNLSEILKKISEILELDFQKCLNVRIETYELNSPKFAFEYNENLEVFIEVPEKIMTGLYRIMCGLPYSMSQFEVYDEAREGMREAQKWILKYGEEYKIDMRGNNLQN
jgi:hypothetical protein